MTTDDTAIILIGYQNDYFATEGVLNAVVEETTRTGRVLENTTELLEKLRDTSTLIVSTPICFTENYSELIEPVGILKIIRDVGAFKEGTIGSEAIDQIKTFGDRVLSVPGKRGLNAFSNTSLHETLTERGIKNIVLAGAVTSICIDTTGRDAYERGYKVVVLSDCTSGRTITEQDFYCDQIFPIYGQVMDHQELLAQLL